MRSRRRASRISAGGNEGNNNGGGDEDELAANHEELPELMEGIEYGLPNYTRNRPRKCVFLTKKCAFYIEKSAILNA